LRRDATTRLSSARRLRSLRDDRAGHTGEDIGPGLLRQIERDLEPCLGKGWLKKP